MEVEPILPDEAALGESWARAGTDVVVVGEDAPSLLDVDLVVAAHLAARVATLVVGDDNIFAIIDGEDRPLRLYELRVLAAEVRHVILVGGLPP